jgi:hypothetical protein
MGLYRRLVAKNAANGTPALRGNMPQCAPELATYNHPKKGREQ